MRRGDVVLVALPGDYGKPRPAVVVQSDMLNASHPSILVCPLTSFASAASDLRPRVMPSPENGCRSPSEIMVDKVTATRRERLGQRVGRLDEDLMRRVDRILLAILGLA